MWLFPWLILTLLLALAAPGPLGSANASLLAQAILIREKGLLPAFMDGPPLPTLLLLPFPKDPAPLLLGALALGLVGALAYLEAWERRTPLPLLLAAPLYVSPLGPLLIRESLGDALGLALGYLAWHFYRRYLREGLALWVFVTGQVAAASAACTPFGLLLLPFFVLGFTLFRPMPRAQWAAATLVFLFPSAVLAGGWSLLAWLISREAGIWLRVYPLGAGAATPEPAQLLLSPIPLAPFLLVLLWLRNPAVLVYAAPLLLALAGLPIAYSPWGLYGLLQLFAAGGLPGRVPALLKGAILVSLLVQIGSFWSSGPPAEGERRLAGLLRLAPAASVLTDEVSARRFLAALGTTQPFLLPTDAGWEAALYTPARSVQRVLVCPGGPLARGYAPGPPEEFQLELAEGECHLYQRAGGQQ